MFLPLIALVIVFVAVVLYLPYASGVATYKVEKSKKRPGQYSKTTDQTNQYQGYLPPDEEMDLKRQQESENSKASGIRNNLNITKSDIPLKFNLKGLRQRANNTTGQPISINDAKRRDPDSYDYDIDDLINEEKEKEANEYKSRINYAKTDKEAMSRYEELA